MTSVLVAAGQRGDVRVVEGPQLLSNLGDGPSYVAHRRRVSFAKIDADSLLDLLDLVDLRGRGGAAFPLARKIRTARQSRGRPVVVINGAEGEPASAKDSSLLTLRPHLVLDGATLVADALGATAIHVVVPGERPSVERAVRAAAAERNNDHLSVHRAECRFVAGESSAVLELLAGRPNLPVTTRGPSAVRGLGGAPTVLSNAETYAQLAVLALQGADTYGAYGTAAEPGTRLLTIDGDGAQPTVVEVEHGTALASVLSAVDVAADGGILVGGYHGAWLPPSSTDQLIVSAEAFAAAGAAIGAGVLLPLRSGECPVRRTTSIVGYLAGESAGRCGPCRFGLPALAEALREVAFGAAASTARLEQLMDTVEKRGSCHHPDGTTRSIRSLLNVFPDEIAAHLLGRCGTDARVLDRQ